MEENRLSSGNIYVGSSNEAKEVLRIIMEFLTLFMPMTLVKRVVSIVLLAAGVSIAQIEFLTGLTGRSVRKYGRTIRSGDTAELLALKEGRGRISKASGMEDQILTEIETGHYHTRQQIVDMVKEKFGISMSLMAVSRFLKKTASRG